jgi:hypothetical protein
MAAPRESLYDILGVPRDAGPLDIQRAFDRFVASLDKAETPPDARRERLVREAHATLSDPAKRMAYDAALAAMAAGAAKGKRGVAITVGSALVALAAGLYGWQALKSSVQPAPAVASRPVAEIAAEAGRALGRVEAYDPSGQVTTLGLGVAVEAGTMVVACPTLVAGAQFKVHNGPRAASARVSHRNESLGLCRLAVEGGGAASPMAVAPAAPAAGDKVLAATLDGTGEAKLVAAKVKRVVAEGARTLVEVEGVVPGASGAVLLDAAGRVLGVAPVSAPAFYALPRSFVAERPSGP